MLHLAVLLRLLFHEGQEVAVSLGLTALFGLCGISPLVVHNYEAQATSRVRFSILISFLNPSSKRLPHWRDGSGFGCLGQATMTRSDRILQRIVAATQNQFPCATLAIELPCLFRGGSAPDQAEPHQARPVQARPHQARIDQARPHLARPDQGRLHPARPDQARLHQARTDQATPSQLRTDQARTDQATPGKHGPTRG